MARRSLRTPVPRNLNLVYAATNHGGRMPAAEAQVDAAETLQSDTEPGVPETQDALEVNTISIAPSDDGGFNLGRLV